MEEPDGCILLHRMWKVHQRMSGEHDRQIVEPSQIMMDTRDRLQEVGKVIDAKGKWEDDGKSLGSYITDEELWACTTCNACTQACPN